MKLAKTNMRDESQPLMPCTEISLLGMFGLIFVHFLSELAAFFDRLR